tara:strand:- start:171 stop:551 length:381 start_codon:yes stop_codon:yes gene_type:complete
MKKFVELAFVSIISILATLSVVNTTSVIIDGGTPFGCSTEDITNMYADYIEKWKEEISSSFDKAEEEIFNKNPTPDIVGPDPDPKKCACGGSGWIEQGDGHKTKCPYHGKGMGEVIGKHGLIIHNY